MDNTSRQVPVSLLYLNACFPIANTYFPGNAVPTCRAINKLNYYSTITPFYHIRANERAKYAALLHCRTGQKYGLKAERHNGQTKLYF